MPLTKREAAIISAYTGYLIGDFFEMCKYAEKKLGRPIWTHEYGSEKLCDELREATKADFQSIEVMGPPQPMPEFTDDEKADMKYQSQ